MAPESPCGWPPQGLRLQPYIMKTMEPFGLEGVLICKKDVLICNDDCSGFGVAVPLGVFAARKGREGAVIPQFCSRPDEDRR